MFHYNPKNEVTIQNRQSPFYLSMMKKKRDEEIRNKRELRPPLKPYVEESRANAMVPILNPVDHPVVSTIMAEGLGESPMGQRAIFNTIQNRSAGKQRSWNDIVSAPQQYSGYGNQNGIYRRTMDQLNGKNTLSPQEMAALNYIKNIVAGNVSDVSGGATHYFNKKIAAPKRWFNDGTQTVEIGNHLFRKGIKY